ncbi:hypothetical protein BDW74DRAFT_180805 [Aspergillus multicolor]|uniref:uncharacterized protein n=1 Tax=Aspergillus multicolor TaxID=41759 RepID=UPI003CCCF082
MIFGILTTVLSLAAAAYVAPASSSAAGSLALEERQNRCETVPFSEALCSSLGAEYGACYAIENQILCCTEEC